MDYAEIWSQYKQSLLTNMRQTCNEIPEELFFATLVEIAVIISMDRGVLASDLARRINEYAVTLIEGKDLP